MPDLPSSGRSSHGFTSQEFGFDIGNDVETENLVFWSFDPSQDNDPWTELDRPPELRGMTPTALITAIWVGSFSVMLWITSGCTSPNYNENRSLTLIDS